MGTEYSIQTVKKRYQAVGAKSLSPIEQDKTVLIKKKCLLILGFHKENKFEDRTYAFRCENGHNFLSVSVCAQALVLF